MSELRSVIAFFLGLVFFVVIIGLALGRIRLPNQKAKTQTVTEQVTPTPIPTAVPTKKPGLLDKIAGIFKKTTPTPTVSPTKKKSEVVVEQTSTPVTEMKEALPPEQSTGGSVVTTKGGQVISIDKVPIASGETIPESGAPTLLIPFSLLLAGLGRKLKKQQ